MKWLPMLFSIVAWSSAWALCVEPPPPIRNMQLHSAVFACEVLRNEKIGNKIGARVRVLRSWKGVRPGSTIFLWGGVTDGIGMEDTIYFTPKERYLVFADSSRGGFLVTGGCDGTRRVEHRNADDAFATLGPGLAPPPWWKWWSRP